MNKTATNLRVGLVNTLQFILGFTLGVVILAGGSTLLGFYLFSRMSTSPAKPIFVEEKPEQEQTANAQQTDSSSADKTTTDTKSKSESDFPKTSSFLEGEAKEEEKSAEDTLEPGAYRAQVTWPKGLILRAQAGVDGERIGGVGYEWEIVILEESSNGKWQKVRIPSSGQVGWVKAGNVKKID